ncbi:MAG: four helix bundle protein [Ruminococcaceae bacterium]|nr:four helix bundle protein [Oscillospiraceae bacterium]
MNDTVEKKSFAFAVRIVNLCRYLESEKREHVIEKQLLRAGTSIGANIAEAQEAQSRADFISKMSIALKEAGETRYWLRLLYATSYLTFRQYESVLNNCREIERMLTAIIKTSKQ